MRIHTDTITSQDLHDAARIARVDFDRLNPVGSRSRDHAFDFTLQGESRRHQNGGDGMAATWDQWGVFLSYLFSVDDNLTIPRVYADEVDFGFKTNGRFALVGWPDDAHGDHTFRWSGTPYQQECTKCSAVSRWQ